MTSNLQLILGNDNSKTDLTVYKTVDGKSLHVYLGVALLEVVPNDRNDFFFRFLAARLYRLGVACTHIAKQLGISEKTIRKLAEALQTGDPVFIRHIFSGHSSKQKASSQIKQYIKEKYLELKDRCSNFTQLIIAKVKKYWQLVVSSEYLRKLYREADKEVQEHNDSEESCKIERNACAGKLSCPLHQSLLPNNVPDLQSESALASSTTEQLSTPLSGEISCATHVLPAAFPGRAIEYSHSVYTQTHGPILNHPNDVADWVGGFPYSGNGIGKTKCFCHHLGLVLFSPWLDAFSDSLTDFLPQPLFKDELELIRQFQTQILLGAVNHEQSLELSFPSLEFLVGPCYNSVDYQRSQLNRLLTQHCFKGLWRANGLLTELYDKSVFYYDPHAKEYTGVLNILKGWCGSVGRITDVLNVDCFHDQAGNPCYAEHFDGYYDQRERLFLCLHNFLEVFPELSEKEIILIFDRGLYSLEVLKELRNRNFHFITWDKDFKKEQWQFRHNSNEFYHSILRNHCDDYIFCHFTYYEEAWSRDRRFRRVVLHAVNEKGNAITVAIICSDPNVNAQTIIVYMVRRWLQENDFSYMVRHVGINELTSRQSQRYSADSPVKDRMVMNREYKKLRDRKKELEIQLKDLTFRKSCMERKQKSLKKTRETVTGAADKLRQLSTDINTTHNRYDNICETIKSTPKKEWRKNILQQKEKSYFITSRKAIMDCIRISARNVFYAAIAIFRPVFNNLRSDHKILRNLLNSPGLVYKENDYIHIELFVRYHLEPKEKEKMGRFIDIMNKKINDEFNGKYSPIMLQITDQKSGLIGI